MGVKATSASDATPEVSPIAIACSAGHVDIVRFLVLEAHVDPGRGRAINPNLELTPLRIACFQGHLELVKFLVVIAGVEVDSFSVTLALHNNHNALRQWLEESLDWSKLMLACDVGDPALVRSLLRSGADPCHKTSKGLSALAIVSPTMELPWETARNAEIREMVEHASGSWKPGQWHRLWPRDFQEGVKLILLLANRLNKSNDMPTLPMEIWFHIISMMPRHWNIPKDADSIAEVSTLLDFTEHDFLNVEDAPE
jgi:hypothetical protein